MKMIMNKTSVSKQIAFSLHINPRKLTELDEIRHVPAGKGPEQLAGDQIQASDTGWSLAVASFRGFDCLDRRKSLRSSQEADLLFLQTLNYHKTETATAIEEEDWRLKC